jgi:NADH:ubiquinone oxidoreductase subunit
MENLLEKMNLEINTTKAKKEIYNGEVEATKIPNEWYSWIHFTNNKIENLHNIEKYAWQKPHKSNQTGSKDAYRPDKKNNEIKKKYKSWKE